MRNENDAPEGGEVVQLQCDYLIVGAGATGMAFADVLLTEGDSSTSIVMVDKRADPGGHWTNAYGFVRLHQSACYYGVPSEKLERDGEVALYRYKDLSSGREVLSYYRFLMDKYQRTGRLRYYAGCTYDLAADDGTFRNDGDGTVYRVKALRRIVDSTYTNVEIPSERAPPYEVHPSVECIPINGLNGRNFAVEKRRKFVVVGAGKTGMDAVLYLLNKGIPESSISWIVSRDAWMFNRDFINPRTAALNLVVAYTCPKRSFDDYLMEMERIGVLLRLDRSIAPTKFSCATIEEQEFDQLHSLSNIIRQGRVKSITDAFIIMEKGEPVPFNLNNTTIVDCTANGLPPRPPVPIWQGNKIILQPVSACQAAFSAAMIGYVECCPPEKFVTDDDRNGIMKPVPHPVNARDLVRVVLLDAWNQFEGYGLDSCTKAWFNSCRLNIMSHSSLSTVVKLFFGFKMYRQLVAFEKGIEAKMAQHKDEFGTDFELFNSNGQQKVSLKLAKATRNMLCISIGLWLTVLLTTIGAAYILSR